MQITEYAIEIRDIHIYAHHGVLDQENRVGNDFLVSIKVYYPISRAMVNDNLSGTINYAEAIEIIKNVMLVKKGGAYISSFIFCSSYILSR